MVELRLVTADGVRSEPLRYTAHDGWMYVEPPSEPDGWEFYEVSGLQKPLPSVWRCPYVPGAPLGIA